MTSSATNKSERGFIPLRAGFTLIEMLAVITIIAIVVAVALPGLKALRGTALQTAVRQVSSEMKLARQYAITQRKTVRFAVCVDPTAMPDLGSNHVCHAYIIAAATNDVNGTLLGWVPVQDWKFLPDGVVFSENNVTASAPPGGSYNLLTLDPLPPLATPTNRLLGPALDPTVTWRYFDSTNSMTLYLPDGTTKAVIVSVVEFLDTGFANQLAGSSSWTTAGLRIMLGNVTDPSNRTLSIVDTNNWAYIEYSTLGGRVRTRYAESYQ